eukprot:PhF_6_TR26704/c1_g1_i2/m.39006
MYCISLAPKKQDTIDSDGDLAAFLEAARTNVHTTLRKTQQDFENRVLLDPCALVYAGISGIEFVETVLPKWNQLVGRRQGLTATEFVDLLKASVIGRFSQYSTKRLVSALERLYHACDAMGTNCVTWEGFTTYLMDSSRAETCNAVASFHFVRSHNINGNMNEEMICSKLYPCPAAKWLVGTTDPGKIHVFDVSMHTMKHIASFMAEAPILCVDIIWQRKPLQPVPKGIPIYRYLMLLTTADMRLRVYEINVKETTFKLRHERVEMESLTFVRYSATDDYVISGNRLGEACVWALSFQGVPTPIYMVRSHYDSITDMQILSRWRFASVSLDMNVVQYDVVHNEENEVLDIRTTVFVGHAKGLHTLVYIPEHKLMVSAGFESHALCWVESQPHITPFKLEDPKEPHKGHIVRVVAISDTSHQVLSIDVHGMVKSWDVSTFLPERSFYGAPNVKRKDMPFVKMISAAYFPHNKCVTLNTNKLCYVFESDLVVPGSAQLVSNYLFQLV